MRNYTILLSFALSALVAACSTESQVPETTTDNGIPYEFHVDKEGASPQVGEYVGVHLAYTSANDSTFYNTFNQDVVYYMMGRPAGYGDPMAFYQMMSPGDSATFYLQADSLFKMMSPPDFIQPGEWVTATIKMESVISAEEYAEIEAARKKAKLEPELLVIRQHLEEQGIEYEESPAGIIYTVDKEGTGKQPGAGDKVKVHYTGKLLDGKKFDSSLDRGEPFPFVINESQVIEGWHKGVPLFKEGGKGTIYIPPSLGYGKRGAGEAIPPNAHLMFDIEVLEVSDPKAMLKKEQQQIENYLNQRGITDYQVSPDGIYYTVERQGDGPKPQPNQKVTVHYRGTLLNGKQFDASYDRGQPFEFVLGRGQVIKGWDRGIPLFNVGGKGTLYLPSSLGYGERGSGSNIPPNSILIFDVEVLNAQ